MSKKKNSIMYIKPQEPSFISRMKAEAGYKEGDTVDTKRQMLPDATDEDGDDRDEEQPVVVVLKAGDISAEEAEKIKSLQKEAAEQAPANLDDRIVFRAPLKGDTELKRPLAAEDGPRKKSKKQSKPTSLLSFAADEDDDEG